MNEPRLCYVCYQWAFFTTQALEDQWGDDWDDAPWEHNAGEPYRYSDDPKYGDTDKEPWRIVKVGYDGRLETPGEYEINSKWSVEQINAGAVPWLKTDRYASRDPQVSIMAGATLEEFKAMVEVVGGAVYTADDSPHSGKG